VRVQTDRLLSITAYFACGSMVRFCLFPEKECSIPPCRRRIGPVVQADAWFGTDCVTPVNDRTYAVDVQTGRLIEMNGPIRLRQHGTL